MSQKAKASLYDVIKQYIHSLIKKNEPSLYISYGNYTILQTLFGEKQLEKEFNKTFRQVMVDLQHAGLTYPYGSLTSKKTWINRKYVRPAPKPKKIGPKNKDGIAYEPI